MDINGLNQLKIKSTSALRRRRTALMKRLKTIEPSIVRGSLIERYKRCGKSGCRCMKGKGHGPKYYLTISISQGKPDVIYVPLDQVEKVKYYLSHFQEVQEILKKVGNINRELLRRRELF